MAEKETQFRWVAKTRVWELYEESFGGWNVLRKGPHVSTAPMTYEEGLSYASARSVSVLSPARTSYAAVVRRLVVRSLHDEKCDTLQPALLDRETMELLREPACDCGAEDDAAAGVELAALIAEVEEYRGAGFNGPWLLQRIAHGYTPETVSPSPTDPPGKGGQ